jgi:protein-tyrosine phosphatase
MSVPWIVADPRRLIALEAAHNVRDLGGYVLGDGRSIRWGRLLRGDGLHHLTAADLDALAPLGLRTVVDLRTPGEVEERGTFPIDRMPVQLVHHPVIDSTWNRDDVPRFAGAEQPEVEFLAWAYATMLAEGGPRFGAAIRRLAVPGALPAIFHCAAGKDRTGILAALLLAGLGVDDDVIVADYGLTAAGIERMKEWLQANRPDRAMALAEAPSVFLAAHPEAMQRTLESVRSAHGSVPGFLETVGVSDRTLTDLADALTR